MKKTTLSILCILCGVLEYISIAQNIHIQQNDAFRYISDLFADRDVDYYEAINNDTCDTWSFFIDAAPEAYWSHECYIATFPRIIDSALFSAIRPQIRELKCPPAGYTLSPYQIKPKGTSSPYCVPSVKRNTQSVRPTEKMNFLGASGRTYAIILSGAQDPTSNNVTFWNNCSFLYRTLRHKYEIPKDDIYVLISDGNDPAIDMYDPTDSACQYVSSPLDLDFDGEPDIELAASKENLYNAINDISNNIRNGDHLFIYIACHGDQSSDGGSLVYLNKTDSLDSKELNSILARIPQKDIFINIAVEACFSGGFLTDITHKNSVITTATDIDHPSYYTFRTGFGHFSKNWISAINGRDQFNDPITSSHIDNDSHTSMEEAFYYAKEATLYDSKSNSTPQYVQYQSNPAFLGKVLAFDRIPPVDFGLHIKDNNNDPGFTPNTTTEIFWNSPDIWIRNQKDSIPVHENPFYSDEHRSAFINVRIHNNGYDYISGKSLALYWAQASTAIHHDVWNGRRPFNGQEKLGGLISVTPVPAIISGHETVMAIEWTLPSDLFDGSRPEKHRFSILARIIDNNSDTTLEGFDVLSDCSIAQCSVSILPKEDSGRYASLFFANLNTESECYDFELQLRSQNDRPLFNYANIAADLAPTIYRAWSRGGMKSNGVEPYTISPYSLLFPTPDTKLQNITMAGNGIGRISVWADFFNADYIGRTYTIDAIQRDKENRITGGHTFIIESPLKSDLGIAINTSGLMAYAENQSTLSFASESPDHIIWFDNENKRVSAGDTLDMTQIAVGKHYSAVRTNHLGELSKSDIYIDPSNIIRRITPSGNVSDHIDVELDKNQCHINRITVVSILDGGVMYDENINSQTNIHINTTSYPHGIYALICWKNGDIVISHRFCKI